MKKYILDLRVKSVEKVGGRYSLLKLTHEQPLPEMVPGQFVEVRVDTSPSTFLRRPISINCVERADTLNCVRPLGNGFTMPKSSSDRVLLVGGGVGVAPLLYMGAEMKRNGIEPTFLLGARSAADLLEIDLFRRYGRVCITTEDASEGEKGFVTNHSVLGEKFDMIATCGPKPMMVAVARYAYKAGVECEASLENMMACGLGACLCCVEKTTEGNLCVCKEGPVLNIKKLLWQL